MDVAIKDADGFAVFLRELVGRVHLESAGEAGALFSVAYRITEGEEPYFLTARCLFEHPKASPRRHDYRELLFDEWWVGTDEAVKILEAIVNVGATLNGFAVPQFYVPSVQRRIGERSSTTGWPEWFFDIRANRQGRWSIPSDPVVRPGLRPYGSGAQAITDWVWRKPTKGTSNPPHENELVLIVPDYRSRIKSADWRARTVTAEVEGPEPDLELQALVLAGGTHHPLQSISNPGAQGTTNTLEVPPETERVELFLVRQSGELADHVVLYAAGEEFEAAAGEPTAEELALTDLRAGEGQEVEFKPFVAPNEQKEEEIVRTIVAFANTQGGRLYIGVRDGGTPEGESALCKTWKAESATGSKLLVERMHHLVREKVKPVPDVTVTPVRVFGEPVIVVGVAASSAGPFSTHDNDVFIRKGATNRKPDPRTELPHIGADPGRRAPIPGLSFKL